VHEPTDLASALAELRAERAAREAAEAARAASDARAQAQIAVLAAAVVRLTEQVAQLLGRRSKKKQPPAATPAPADTAAEPDPSPGDLPPSLAGRPTPPEIPAKAEKPKGAVRPSGRKHVPEHLVTDTESHRPGQCGRCGGEELRIVGEEITHQLDTIREHLRRREIVRKRCLCNHCYTTTLADMPAMPWNKSKFTANMLAHIVYTKMGLHVPLDRMRRDFELRGVKLAISTLVSAMTKTGDLLAAIDKVHWDELVAGDWMNADGSGIDVVVKDEGVARGIIDVFTRDDIAVYTFSVSKNGTDFAKRLAGFTGTLVADAESRMNETYATGAITEGGCNSHGIRKFDAAESEYPGLAEEGRQFVAAMFYWEDQGREKELTADALLAWRREHIAPIADDFRRWIDVVREHLVPGTPLRKAVNYYYNHWDALMRFLGDPKIPMHNNAAERLFRALDTGRHNWLFAGNEDSAHNLAVLMGLVATCRLQGIDPQNYLAWAIERRGTWRERYGLEPAELTPAAYGRWLAKSRE
jgi:transposase